MGIKVKVVGILAACTVAFGAPMGVGNATASPTTVFNGVLSTVGGCQTPNLDLIKFCTRAEALTPETPLALKLNPVGTRIVVLGAGLNRNGTMKPVLISRLKAALSLARSYPTAGIITTGGLPKGGHTEAQAMRKWLIANGVWSWRLATENRSRSTVENARYTARMLAAGRATGAVVVTSPNHLKRAMIDFRSAVRGSIPISGVISGYTNGGPASDGSIAGSS